MTVIDWQLATNSCVHRHVYGCKMICGSISKILCAISAFFFPRQRVGNRSGLQTAVVLPWEWTGIWEEASRPMMRRSVPLQTRSFRLHSMWSLKVKRRRGQGSQELSREALGVYINGSQAHLQSHHAARMGEVSCTTFQLCHSTVWQPELQWYSTPECSQYYSEPSTLEHHESKRNIFTLCCYDCIFTTPFNVNVFPIVEHFWLLLLFYYMHPGRNLHLTTSVSMT